MNFSWPILPPPRSTRGQLFTAKLPSGKPHNALDMGTGGDVVLAPAAGTVVVNATTKDSRGRIMHINHDGGYQTRYYHLAGALVGRGPVSAGQRIALVGRTGLPRNNPHLHFMIYAGCSGDATCSGGYPIDPQSVLPPREGFGYFAQDEYEQESDVSEDTDDVLTEGEYEDLPAGEELDAGDGAGGAVGLLWVAVGALALWLWRGR